MVKKRRQKVSVEPPDRLEPPALGAFVRTAIVDPPGLLTRSGQPMPLGHSIELVPPAAMTASLDENFGHVDDQFALEAALFHLRTQAPNVQDSDPAELADSLARMLAMASRLLRANVLSIEARASLERRTRAAFAHFVDRKDVTADQSAAVINRIESALVGLRGGEHANAREAANHVVRTLFYSWPDSAHALSVEPAPWPPALRASDDLVAVIEAGVVPKKPREKRLSYDAMLATLLGKTGIQSTTAGSVATKRSIMKRGKQQS